MMRRALVPAVVAALALASPAQARLPRGDEPVTLDPAHFTTAITNPWLPLRPGRRTAYRETAPDGTRARDVVTVTHPTRLLANGVTARVVHDVAVEDGRVTERTDDYFAQDRAGNVWYLGEATTAYEPGEPPSTEGSWESGVDGAYPGIAMPAHPRAGLRCRQESAPDAKDRASIIRRGEQVSVPYGHFRHVLVTRETTPLEPRAVECKFYVRGIGEVLAIGVSGDADRSELVRLRR